MRTGLQSRLLVHLLKAHQSRGYTLIELLVTIVMIGILSAIALPTFLNQSNKAKQTEAKTYIGSMNRAQQAVYLEDTAFADQANFERLGLGIPQQTSYYQYAIVLDAGGTVVTNQARVLVNTSPIRAYIGGVRVTTAPTTGELASSSYVCEATLPRVNGGPDGNQTIGTGGGEGSQVGCPTTYRDLSN